MTEHDQQDQQDQQTTDAAGDPAASGRPGSVDGQSASDERGPSPEVVAAEIAREQEHVDKVYLELIKAEERAGLVQAEGLQRGRTDRTGDVRDEEAAGLFERDAMVYAAAKRRHNLDRQHEGLVFGRLDLDSREVRYVGRLGVRDDDYEPLVIDWRAPAAAAFYRATPVDPHGVIRRRVLTSRGQRVVSVEDDLMVPDPPEDIVTIGDGALLAALTRSRGSRMRDIVATIQAHQDMAIRASARGVTEITGGPGTGKTVVALHRAAYLLYADRRRFESGGILVVGPSAAYTAYIERVLPSLGEESVVLRSVGDVVDAATATVVDEPVVARVKGSLQIRTVLSKLAAMPVPGAPERLRVMVKGQLVSFDAAALGQIARGVLRHQQRNASQKALRDTLGQRAWEQVVEGRAHDLDLAAPEDPAAEIEAAAWLAEMRELQGQGEDLGELSDLLGDGDAPSVGQPKQPVQSTRDERDEFLSTFEDHLQVDSFLEAWWRPVDAREVLLWLADPEVARECARGVLATAEIEALSASMRRALQTGEWSVGDVALIDELAAKLGPLPERAEERGFYEVELLDDLEGEAIASGSLRAQRADRDPSVREGTALGVMAGSGSAPDLERSVSQADLVRNRERLLRGRMDPPATYAHVLVDEAQDLSPMQWRMVGRRGQTASWTIVGDAAQASWPDAAEARAAMQDATAGQQRRHFHMSTNYRNAREIFGYAAEVILPVMPDADIPEAVRETGVHPVVTSAAAQVDAVLAAARSAVDELGTQVPGSIAVIAPEKWRSGLGSLDEALDGRVVVIDPLSTKGLEYDATVVVDPGGITAESPGGARVLYVVLTRAAHRMHVLEVTRG